MEIAAGESHEKTADSVLTDMQIIAHRGFWLDPSQKNTQEAFERALRHGFGIETDFRDHHGELVIAHDLPVGNEMLARDFFTLCKQYPQSRPHALNVKADGLQTLLSDLISQWHKEDYFLFDMSIPDTLGYLNLGMSVYTRMSEYEDNQNLEGKGSGIWLDAFLSEGYPMDLIIDILARGKEVALVSPELHGRPHLKYWELIKAARIHKNPQLSLCTDHPLMAKEYFNE